MSAPRAPPTRSSAMGRIPAREARGCGSRPPRLPKRCDRWRSRGASSGRWCRIPSRPPRRSGHGSRSCAPLRPPDRRGDARGAVHRGGGRRLPIIRAPSHHRPPRPGRHSLPGWGARWSWPRRKSFARPLDTSRCPVGRRGSGIRITAQRPPRTEPLAIHPNRDPVAPTPSEGAAGLRLAKRRASTAAADASPEFGGQRRVRNRLPPPRN